MFKLNLALSIPGRPERHGVAILVIIVLIVLVATGTPLSLMIGG